MCRVLKTGGHLVILELSTPDRFPMKQLFTIYSKVVIPLLGKCLSKDNSAYTYLPQSIRAFPQGEVMQEVIRKAGFSQVNFRRHSVYALFILRLNRVISDITPPYIY